MNRKSFVILLILYFATCLYSQQIIYVNQNSPEPDQLENGSRENPFKNLTTVVAAIDSPDIEIILLGNELIVDDKIKFPLGINSILIKPEIVTEERKYFPLSFRGLSSIETNLTNLTIENVQIIELDSNRDPNTNVFAVLNGVITLKSSYVANIIYPDNSYMIIFSQREEGRVEFTAMRIIDCYFHNLLNAQVLATNSAVMIQGTVFSDIVVDRTSFVTIYGNVGPDSTITLLENTVKNSFFSYFDPFLKFFTGFLDCASCTTNIFIKDLIVKNVTLTNSIPLIWLTSTYEDPTWPTTFTIINTTLEDVYEAFDERAEGPQNTGIGLIFDITGCTHLVMIDFYAKNVLLNYDALLRYSPNDFFFLGQMILKPTITIKNIKLIDCSNPNFLSLIFDEGHLENVELQDIRNNGTEIFFPFFLFEKANKITIKDVYGKNVTGPVLKLTQIFNQQIHNFTFDDIWTSQEFSKENQNIVQLLRNSAIYSMGLDSTEEAISIINGFNINGFRDIGGISNTQDSNDTYMITMQMEFGPVIIQNSRWHNIEMGCFMSTSIKSLKVDNVIVDADPNIPAVDLPWHRIFQFVNIEQLEMINTEFRNNQNVVILSLFNIDRSSLFTSVDTVKMKFDNITVINNMGNYWSSNTTYLGLFLIDSPLKAVEINFTNSKFEDNKYSNGLIMTLESYKVDVTIANNVFDNNYALVGGTIFAAQTMQDNENNLNITNNIFSNNRCFGNGAVFSFINCWHNIISTKNTYTGNSALNSGGVGYVQQTKLTFLEEDTIYMNNFAAKTGGAWYFSTSYQWSGIEPIKFVRTTFFNSRANINGGAIYLTIGNLSLDNCFFHKSTALTSGGDIYLLTFSSLRISKSTFSESYASQGSFLYADSLYEESVIIEDSVVENIYYDESATTVLQLNSGQLNITNTNFNNITCSLFRLTGTSAVFNKIFLKDIHCYTSNYFCILQGNFISLNFSNSQITGVASNSDLIYSNSPTKYSLIDNVQISDVTTFIEDTIEDKVQLYAMRFLMATNVTINNSKFESFNNFSSIIMQKSTFNIDTTTFTNKLSGIQQRILSGKPDFSILPDKVSGYSQFLVFVGCSGVVNNSEFINNAPKGEVNGGAIQIQGQGGDYKIEKCLFQNNQAQQGGALSVEGQANSFVIEGSNFFNNIAIENGGGIYFANQSVHEMAMINNTQFQENRATRGGAIFVANQRLQINSTIFKKDEARDGGAIASFAENTEIVYANYSSFIQNKAKVGPVFRALGTNNFIAENVLYDGNIAEIGGNIATNPKQLTLVIYEVDEYFLFLKNVDAQYMIDHSRTKIVFDSRNPERNQPLIQKTGRAPNYLFEFMFLDELGENLPTIEQASIKVSIKNYSSPSSQMVPDLLGRAIYNFNTTTNYIFNSFFIRGGLDTNITFSAQGTFTNTFFKQIEALPSLEWKITIGPCSPGEIYDSSNYLCSPCPAGTYSFDDPYYAQSCRQCKDSMTCLGGKIMFPNRGFWRMTNTSDNILQCFNNEACLGGQRDEGKDVSLTGFCEDGYEGVNCGSCIEGFAKFGTSQKCINCSTNAGYYIRFLAFLLIQVAIITIAAKAYLDYLRSDGKDKRSALIKAMLAKIVVDFVQLLNLTWEFNFRWPQEVGDFLEAITKVTPTNKDALSVGCFISLIKGDNEDIFFIKLLLLVVQPILYMFIATLILTLVYRLKKRNILHNKEFRRSIMMTSIVIIYVLQPGIFKSTLQLFNCRNFGPLEDPEYYLIEDTNIKCWETTHMSWALALGIPSFIIWTIIPVGLLVYAVIKMKMTGSTEFRKKFNYVFDGYKDNFYYWEIVIFARKFCVIIFSVFLTFTFLQAYVSFFFIVIFYVMQSKASPYLYKCLNTAEKLSLFASGFLLYTALFFIRDERLESVVPLLLAFDTVFGVVFLTYCLFVLMSVVWKRFPRLKEKYHEKILHLASKKGYIGGFFRKFLPKPKGETTNPTTTTETLITLTRPIESAASKTTLPSTITNLPDTENLLIKQISSLTECEEKIVRKNVKIGTYKSNSSEFTEESTPNVFRSSNRLNSLKSDEGPRLFSIRGTETDIVFSRGDLSMNRKSSYQTRDRLMTITSQLLDLDDERALQKMGSMPELYTKNDLDVVVEEAPTLKKSMLKDDRFKDLDRVEIHIDDEDLQRTRCLESELEANEEVMNLSALREIDNNITHNESKVEKNTKDSGQKQRNIDTEKENEGEEEEVVGLSALGNASLDESRVEDSKVILGLSALGQDLTQNEESKLEIQTEREVKTIDEALKEEEKEEEEKSAILLSLSVLVDKENFEAQSPTK